MQLIEGRHEKCSNQIPPHAVSMCQFLLAKSAHIGLHHMASTHSSLGDQRSASSRNPTLWRGLLYSFQHARTLRVRATLVADLSGTLQLADRMVVVGEAGEEREAEGPLSLELCKVGQGRRSCACRYVPRTQCICQWWESCWLCTVTSNIRLWPWLRVLVRSSIEPSLFAGE